MSWSNRLARVFENTFQQSLARGRRDGLDPERAWERAVQDALTIVTVLLKDASSQRVFRPGRPVDRAWSDLPWNLDTPSGASEDQP